MASIIEFANLRNVINDVVGEHLVANPDERKVLTFLTESGGVHTIIVDVDHPAKTADELLKWFEHTRGIATASPSDAASPAHVTPEKVIATANERMGFVKAGDPTDGEPAHTTDTAGG